MKGFTIFLGFLLLTTAGCAHNPRPESPEQRAERQAQSFQAQQDAQAPAYTRRSRAQPDTTQDRETADGSSAQPENQPTTAAQAREQAAMARQTLRATRESLAPGTMGVTGGLLR
jgi:hypothetical protein